MFGFGVPELIIVLIIFLPYFINVSMAISRGKSVLLILLLTLIFSWIVTLILVFVPKKIIPDPADPNAKQGYWFEDTGEKKCPYCAESIKSEAIYCRSCGNNVD